PKPDLAKAKVNMKQIVIPAPSKEELKAVQAQAEKLRKSIKSCTDFDEKARAMGIPESGDMGTLRVKDLAPGLQQLAGGIPLGQPSPVLMSPGGGSISGTSRLQTIRMTAPPEAEPQPVAAPAPPPIDPKDIKMPPREEIERDLINERADLLARRYLRDLRRTAFVEIRN
ncbi:peptidylprolyl isomerase, partial [Azospirillum brasilense]|nr:peptidylprolyl isomerase [Azospirillum brasilense]